MLGTIEAVKLAFSELGPDVLIFGQTRPDWILIIRKKGDRLILGQLRGDKSLLLKWKKCVCVDMKKSLGHVLVREVKIGLCWVWGEEMS